MKKEKLDLFQAIDKFCQKNQLLPPGSRVILGLSGGPDSIFLLNYLAPMHHNKQIYLVTTHLDHQWRSDSHKDAEFCTAAANALGVPIIIGKAKELSLNLKFNGSLEELGRLMRRQFLQKICTEEKADLIALAHQAQDQEETFFIRMIRGSSLTGLAAMRPKQGNYIRPLLSINRQEIIEHLHTHNITYVTDPTNESDLFLRNRIRKSVLPALRSTDTRFDLNFARTLAHLQETEDYLIDLTISTLNDISITQGCQQSICNKKFNKLHPILKKRVLIAWLCHAKVPFTPTEKFLNEIINFLAREAGSTHQLHPHWGIIKLKQVSSIKKF